MAALTTLVDGTIPVAADFNSNFTALNAEVRPYNTGGTGQSAYTKGDILIAAAANSLTRLAISAVTGSSLVVLSTGIPGWGGPALYKSGADITTASSTSEISLLNGVASPGPYSVLANTLSTANRLRIFMISKVTNTSGSTRTFTYKVKYGGTTMTTKAVSVVTGNTDASLLLVADVFADALTNAQLAQMTTTAQLAAGNAYDQQVGTAAIDSTAAQNLDVTVTNSFNAATVSNTMQYVMVELVI